MAQVIYIVLEESAFLLLPCNTDAFEYRNNFFYVLGVLILRSSEDDDTIEIYHKFFQFNLFNEISIAHWNFFGALHEPYCMI